MTAEETIQHIYDQEYIIAEKKADQQAPNTTDKIVDGSVWLVVENVKN